MKEKMSHNIANPIINCFIHALQHFVLRITLNDFKEMDAVQISDNNRFPTFNINDVAR